MSALADSAIKTVETDVLIIGTGGAGLRAAIEAGRHGVDVLLADKSLIGLNNNTRFSGAGIRAASRGGVAAGMVSSYESPLEHFKDNLRSGGFLNDQRLQEVLCFEAPSRVLELLDFGLDKLSEMMMHCSYPHGSAIVFPMLDTIKKMNIKTYRRLFLFDLVKDGDTVVGAFGFDAARSKFVLVKAKATVLATGGAGEAYERNEDAMTSTGDGYGMAYRAGVPLRDMEFVHFEPYVHAETDMPMMDRHESRAGGLGILRNSEGEDFLPRYIRRIGPASGAFHEQYGVFMPDVRSYVSIAMAREVYEGRGDHGAVWYDFTHLPEKIWRSDIPSQYLRYVLARGCDVRKKPFRVFPAVIVTLGGICINEECETSLSGLFAAGEVTGGVHGAMRLGGNALTDTIVFGARAGQSAARYALSARMPKVSPASYEAAKKLAVGILERRVSSAGDLAAILKQIKSVMWQKVGILRERRGLEAAIEALDDIERKDLPKLFAPGPLQLRPALECINMLTSARMIARSALMREDSWGGHYRLDFPLKDNRKWLKNIIARKVDGEIKLSTQPVALTRFSPDQLAIDSPLARALDGIERLNIERVRG